MRLRQPAVDGVETTRFFNGTVGSANLATSTALPAYVELAEQ